MPDAKVAFIAVEFGTRDISTVLTALRADNWLYINGAVGSEMGKSIKSDIRDAFYPEADDWKQSVWSRSCEVVDRTIAAIGDTKT